MTASLKRHYTLEEYLELEQGASEANEFVDGWLFPRSGISIQHNMIAGNILNLLREATEGSKRVVYVSQFRIRIPGDPPAVYYPDLIVAEKSAESNPTFITEPSLIVEITSRRTEYTDLREKRINYGKIESLETYLIVHQHARHVEVCRRSRGGSWSTQMHDDGEIRLEQPAAKLRLEQIYENIDFQV